MSEEKVTVSFYNNPYSFAKKLFTETKSGKLNVLQEELKNHLRMINSDAWKDVPTPSRNDLPRPQDPKVMFNNAKLMLKEIWEFVPKFHAGNAFGINGISYTPIRWVWE